MTYKIEYRARGGKRDKKRSYRRNLILSDVTEAIKKVRIKQVEGGTQTISMSQPKRMLESTPYQTSGETSDQTQQDHLNKKQRLGLLSPIGRVVDEAFLWLGGDRRPVVNPLDQPDKMMEKGSISLPSGSATDHRKEEVPG